MDSRPTTDDRRLAVGILGGTFDPIHYGHLRPAQEACTQLELAELRFVPAFRSPLRASPVAAREHRLRMVELAIHGLAGFRLDDRELRRGGVSYTVTTLEELRGELGDRALCLIIGMDQFRSFEHWHRWREILDLGHLVVLNRPGCEPPSPPDWAAARLTADGAALARTAAGRLVFLTVQPQDISATRIRERLARGESVAGLVPPAVIEYIQSNRLYGR